MFYACRQARLSSHLAQSMQPKSMHGHSLHPEFGEEKAHTGGTVWVGEEVMRV